MRILLSAEPDIFDRHSGGHGKTANSLWEEKGLDEKHDYSLYSLLCQATGNCRPNQKISDIPRRLQPPQW